MAPIHMRYRRRRAEQQHGQIMILFALMLVLLLGLAAIVVDLGMLRRSSANLAVGVDAGALAGGSQLPTSSVSSDPNYYGKITTEAVKYLNANYPSLGATSTWISYVCLVGANPGAPPTPRLTDVTVSKVCVVPSPASATWTCSAKVCMTPCNATVAGNICNVIVVSGATDVAYRFAPALGIGSGSTGNIQAAACQGACGGPPSVPLDIVVIIDRTTSMTNSDLGKAESAARSILMAFDPSLQHVALGVLPQSSTTSKSSTTSSGNGGFACQAGAYSVPLTSTLVGGDPGGTWVPVIYPAPALPGTALASNYQTSPGVLNESSQLVNTINCLTQAAGTDQGDAVAAATNLLTLYGRTVNGVKVKQDIILLTDGKPQVPSGSDNGTNPFSCKYASNKAISAKAAGIELYTIGFGVVTTDGCPDATGSVDNAGKDWHGQSAIDLLSGISTQPALGTTDCTAAENTDKDHFFCLPKSGDLTSVFGQVIEALGVGPHLIALPYPIPSVTGVSPATGGPSIGGNIVTITGLGFTGAVTVQFGGGAVGFSFVSDTSITARAPAGTNGQVVDITVTTPGGTSITTPADRYTYGP